MWPASHEWAASTRAPGTGEEFSHTIRCHRAVEAARGVILDLRDRGEIGDDAFFRLEEELEGTALSATPRDEVVP